MSQSLGEHALLVVPIRRRAADQPNGRRLPAILAMLYAEKV